MKNIFKTLYSWFVDGENNMHLLPAPKDERIYVCKMCNKNHNSPHLVINCCVSQILDPFRVGSIVKLNTFFLSPPPVGLSHWNYKIDTSTKVTKHYCYFVITEKENTIVGGKSIVKYHFKTKVNETGGFGYGYLTSNDIEKYKLELPNSIPPQVAVESKEFIGQSFNIALYCYNDTNLYDKNKDLYEDMI